ncbi:hypothetical protein J6O48_03665 [bacterium]|nr:hypothetical protein [bacterium]
MYDPIEYFDEMQILKSEKEKRVKLSKKMKKMVENFFVKQLAAILAGAFLHTISSEDFKEELFDIYITMMSQADKSLASDKEVSAKAQRFAEYIEETTEKTYQKATGNGRFELSRQIGVAMLKEDIPDVINKVLSPERALEIALNETNWIYNYIQHQNIKASGQLTHTWLSQEDERVRPSHAAADGQTVPIDQPFIVGGYQLLFPGDDSLGADIKETILCRCVEV